MSTEKYKISYIFESDFNPENVNEIDPSNLRILYANDLYDGPLEGVCEWKNEKLYFFLKDLELRTYYLIRLTKEQLSNDQSLHLDYVRYVESHPYVTEGALSYRKDAEWDAYHKAAKAYPDQNIKKEQVLGWFKCNVDQLKKF